MSPFNKPLEQLVQRGIRCGCCGRLHRTNLRSVTVARGALLRLPEILGRYRETHIHITADPNTMAAAGNAVVKILGEQGFDIGVLTLPDGVQPDGGTVGRMMLEIPRGTGLVLAVGSGALHELVKYWSFQSGVPFISVPTAASGDGFAMPTGIFIENGRRRILQAEGPVAVVADLDVIAAAPKNLAPRGAAEVLSRFISVFDWKLAGIVEARYYCDDLAEALLGTAGDFLDSLQGSRPLYSVRTLEMLMRALIFSGIAVAYAESSAPVYGSETLISECVYMTGGYRSGAVDSIALLKAIAASNCTRIAEGVAAKRPNFRLAATLLENYGWVMRNREIVRVYGGGAADIFSGANSYTSFNEELHKKRLAALEENWEEVISAAMEIVPPYAEYREILRSCTLPYRFEDAGMDKSEAMDAVLWSGELSERYNLLSLIWEIGEIDSVAEALTARMKERDHA